MSILSQIPTDVGPRMKAAIDAVPYASAVKIGLQFKRRFWEEDEAIYGGISYTDLPIRQISYPSSGFNRSGRGVLLGAYVFEGANAYEFTSMTPADRIARAVGIRRPHSPAIRRRVRKRNGRGLAPRSLRDGMRGKLERESAGGTLRQSVPDRRQDRVGGRTRFLHSGMAGRRDLVVARRHYAAA